MGNLFETPITALHGVGAVRAKAYSKLGIENLNDLLRHFERQTRGCLSDLIRERKNDIHPDSCRHEPEILSDYLHLITS